MAARDPRRAGGACRGVGCITRVIGEIGNNCFDHNLGQWPDVPGCWFDYGFEGNIMWTVVADRGRGILGSLKTVQPQLKNDQEALEIAFHKKISGRSPEQRGNGLKLVRSVINGHSDRGLIFLSGEGRFTGGNLSYDVGNPKGRGAFALVLWKEKNEN